MAKAQSKIEKKQPQYGSDVVVDLMKAFDIEYAAFNPGATFRGIHDSIVNYGGNYKPEVIFCNHEEISVAVAHGYAKVTGKPMIAITHNMVGLQHASMAIFNAYIDRVPILVLGGTGPMNTKRRRPRIDWIHTALVQGNQVRDYVKWDDQPYTLADVPDSRQTRQLVWAQGAALRLGKDRNRNGWVKPLVEEALMRRGVVEPDERLVGLFQLGRCVAQRKLVVVQASLNVEMRLHQIHVTLALGAENGLVVNFQTRTDHFELIGDIGSATIRNQGVGNPVAEAGGTNRVIILFTSVRI